MSFYDIEVKSITGEVMRMERFKNQLLLIVNVASKCGFTPQYEGLQALYETYKEQGFVVLGFPCNQFLNQEPLDDAGVQSFCSLNFGVTFPLFSKVDVNGEHTHPLFAYLKKEQKGLLGSEAIKWNFTKFLVDKKGNVIARYAPSTTPQELEKTILEHLND